jgi:hypothetical protein
LETPFQPVSDPSVPAVIEVVNVAMRTYSLAPASEPKITNPTEVQDAIQGFKFGKAPGPNGVPNRALKHLALSAVSILFVLFNMIFRIQYFPSASKQARVFSIPKPGKDLAPPSSYRHKSLLGKTGKLFEKILLTRVLCEISGHGLLRNEQFVFIPTHNTSLHLTQLVERFSRAFSEKRLTGAVFLHVAKASDNVRVDSLLYKIRVLGFPLYFVKTVSSYFNSHTIEASVKIATSTSRHMRPGTAEGEIISPVLIILYVRKMSSPSRNFELSLYMENMAVIATSYQPGLLVKYLDTYLSDLEQWLSEWRIVINVSKLSAMLFAKAGRCIPKPRPVQLFREPLQWVNTARYLGVIIDKLLPWSTHIDQVSKKAAHRLGALGPLLNRRSLSIWNGVLLYK